MRISGIFLGRYNGVSDAPIALNSTVGVIGASIFV